jgi:hypothetical protein
MDVTLSIRVSGCICASSILASHGCEACLCCAELKVHCISRKSLVGRCLSRLRGTDCSAPLSHQYELRRLQGDSQEAAMSCLLADRLPGAFQLAAMSTTLHGLDLPGLLPLHAAVPQQDVLLCVQESVIKARDEVLFPLSS